jgi:hypothetical protein
MVITGSALLIRPGAHIEVLERLKQFPEVTFHVKSESGTELVVNLEAEDHDSLERLCTRIKEAIPEIIEIAHVYVNFEDEIEKIKSVKIDNATLHSDE